MAAERFRTLPREHVRYSSGGTRAQSARAVPSFSAQILLRYRREQAISTGRLANKVHRSARVRVPIDSSRPLPEEYLRYAREDTHYLLYIYDLLRNRLLEVRNKNPQLLQSVYAKSKMICQKVICCSLRARRPSTLVCSSL